MRAVVDHRARRTRGPDLAGGPRPGARAGRGAGRGRGQRGQPGRPAAAAGLLRPAARRLAVPGLECSGRIAALGAGVDRLGGRRRGVRAARRRRVRRAGRRAGRAAAAGARRASTWSTAAALPEVACTVWSNVFMLARLRPGETLLVHGGAQRHRHDGDPARRRRVGARVAVTAGRPAKLRALPRAGRRRSLINYREQDFVEEVRAATDGHGADVILDNMGAKYLARNVDALAVNGRLVDHRAAGRRQGRARPRRAAGASGRAVLATSLRARPPAEKAAIVAAVREHVWPLVEAGDGPAGRRPGAADGATPPRRTGWWRPSEPRRQGAADT